MMTTNSRDPITNTLSFITSKCPKTILEDKKEQTLLICISKKKSQKMVPFSEVVRPVTIFYKLEIFQHYI